MTTAMAAIELANVTKRYEDGTVAVADVDLTIDDGELAIGDEVVNDRAAKHRDIAMVFQNYARR